GRAPASPARGWVTSVTGPRGTPIAARGAPAASGGRPPGTATGGTGRAATGTWRSVAPSRSAAGADRLGPRRPSLVTAILVAARRSRWHGITLLAGGRPPPCLVGPTLGAQARVRPAAAWDGGQKPLSHDKRAPHRVGAGLSSFTN